MGTGAWAPSRWETACSVIAEAQTDRLLLQAERIGRARGFLAEGIAQLDKRTSYQCRKSLDRALEALR